jgi:branched-chain amino acid transport system ATP-binding protein
MKEALIEVTNVSKYFGGLKAVNSVSFQVNEGETFGIIGPNGSGKTTLLKLISGFEKPEEGSILFNGTEISGMSPDMISRRGIARTFQIPQVFPSMNVLDNVLVGSFIPEPGRANKGRKKALEILEVFDLINKRDVNVHDLNIAELKRLEIAKALAMEPNCILLDEVVAGLTRVETDKLINLIMEKLQNRGLTILLVEHVMRAISSLCTRLMVLEEGNKISVGLPKEVMEDEKVIKCYLGEDYLA